MNSILLSTYISDKGDYTSKVFKSGDSYHVFCIGQGTDATKYFTFKNLEVAENFAEDWVL